MECSPPACRVGPLGADPNRQAGGAGAVLLQGKADGGIDRRGGEHVGHHDAAAGRHEVNPNAVMVRMPAFGLESIEARQNSFGAVAPVASVTVWACQPFGFCLESRPIAGWIVATKALLVPTSTQAKPTTGFERMKASGCRGMVAPVVTDSFARCPCCALAVNDTSAR